MAIPHDNVFSTPPFKFLVGPDQKPFIIHVGLITKQSKPLSRLVIGQMSEAREECARLEDVDESTFGRFIRYAYTGDYLSAEPAILFDSSMPSTAQSVLNMGRPVLDDQNYKGIPFGGMRSPSKSPGLPSYGGCRDDSYGGYGNDSYGGYGSLSGPVRPVSFKSKRDKLWKELKEKSYTTPLPPFQPRKNQEPCEDYTEVFLSHARLYAFAEKYDVAPLCQLSLHKLHRTVIRFTLYDDRRGDIIELMRYTYMNTPDLTESMDPLRSLVIHYAAYVVEKLAKSNEFQSLLEELGQLGRDLVLKMLEKLE